MDEQKFIDLLAEHTAKQNVKWRRVPMGGASLLRTSGESYDCPISFVCNSVHGTQYGFLDYCEAGQRLGLSKQAIKNIQSAADEEDIHKKSLRAKLLKALNLSEVEA